MRFRSFGIVSNFELRYWDLRVGRQIHCVGPFQGPSPSPPPCGVSTFDLFQSSKEGQPFELLRITPASELNRDRDSESLPLSRRLQAVTICRITGKRPARECPSLVEWFEERNLPADTCPIHGGARQGERTAPDSPEGPTGPLRLTRPTAGLQLAMDPRIPDELEVFPFMLPETLRPIRTEWLVDGRVAGRTGKGEQRFLWPLSRGEHRALARVWLPGTREAVETRPVTFRVK